MLLCNIKSRYFISSVMEPPVSPILFEFAIYSIFSYVAGFMGVIGIIRLKSRIAHGKDERLINEAIVQDFGVMYSNRLLEYENTITDMKKRIENLEQMVHNNPVKSTIVLDNTDKQPHGASVSVPPSISTPISTSQPQESDHAQVVSNHVTITQQQHSKNEEMQNGTNDYILKLIQERPRTSREIQHAIGRTREHTSRLMKKLYGSGLVDREIESKPFRYSITEAGRMQLKVRPETGSHLVKDEEEKKENRSVTQSV